MRHEKLAEAYRWADAFLFPARREACPNAVLEARASGLPVWYHPEGGTAEIAAPYGVEQSGSPEADLERMRARHAALAARVAMDRPLFTIERPGQEYVALFSRLCEAKDR
jgi:glycosyltransferase involved in cell wall biosynthesis